MLIGACIPCLYPLVKKIFGLGALGSSPGAAEQQPTLVTIGGTPPEGRRRAAPKPPLGISDIETVASTTPDASTEREGGSEDNWPYEMLRDDGADGAHGRHHQPDAAELWATDAVHELELQQWRVEQETEEELQRASAPR